MKSMKMKMVIAGLLLSIVVVGFGCVKNKCHNCTLNNSVMNSEVTTCNDDAYKADLESQGYTCVEQ